jgi:hypothetical protein
MWGEGSVERRLRVVDGYSKFYLYIRSSEDSLIRLLLSSNKVRGIDIDADNDVLDCG